LAVRFLDSADSIVCPKLGESVMEAATRDRVIRNCATVNPVAGAIHYDGEKVA
jgi:hypothetical protein